MDISDIKDPDYFIGKKSKANTKMIAYLDELLKNKPFQKKIKLLKKERDRDSNFKKLPRIYSITERYQKLKRGALSASNHRYTKLFENIITEYGISPEAIVLATAMSDGNYDFVRSQMHDVHLCTINDDYLNHIFPLNPADDFIH